MIHPPSSDPRLHMTWPQAVRRLATWVVPLFLTLAVFCYWRSEELYLELLREDGPVEWLTYVCLVGASVLAGAMAIRLRARRDVRLWFFVAFCIGSLLAGLEEISWGQRVFGVESPEFFLQASSQGEINVHNPISNATGIRRNISQESCSFSTERAFPSRIDCRFGQTARVATGS